ncbi:hypothetical protein LOTGIDRAFT_162066 [Lottia gigantea]|uniref:Uncharacterized protein n=1 Tax=Lottia gigantea TaxID=225164 RepID=V3ZNU0_LOTGI|nr:hypothetical protein LOTGIDRAFT_162066 [Lottia gigantea]ESO93043.1 hypothetical protein LOTGIDRAFT_162066 [Lottia gigantea]
MGTSFTSLNAVQGLPNNQIPVTRKRKHYGITKPLGLGLHKKTRNMSMSSSDEIDSDGSEMSVSDTEALMPPSNVLSNSQSNDVDLLTQLDSEFNGDEPTTTPIMDRLASIVNKRFINKLSDDKLKEKTEKYLRPSNCEELTVPLVNQEIWGKLSKMTKTQDLRMAGIQKSIIKASVAISNSVDVLLKKDTSSEVVTQLVDAIALLGNASQDLSY